MSETKTFEFSLVSAEKSIFSGKANLLVAKTKVGELGIAPGHTQLLAELKPADLWLRLENQEEQVFYVSGGILEVQPYSVTVLSDTILRAEDLDEAQVLSAKQRAESLMQNKNNELEYAQALVELTQALAQLQALNRFRKKH